MSGKSVKKVSRSRQNECKYSVNTSDQLASTEDFPNGKNVKENLCANKITRKILLIEVNRL